jgi:small-conductance mechanosensitive channel
MDPTELVERIGVFLNTGIAGTPFTPLKLIIVLTLIALLIWVTGKVTRWSVRQVLSRRHLDASLTEALGTVLRYIVVSLGIIVILQSAGINLTSLNVLIGAIGVGLGFGLQHITSNFVSGLIVLFERPVRIGDRIQVADVVGQVREVAARATMLVTDDNVAVLVPNSQLISERVKNWNRPQALTAYQLRYFVTVDSDPERVREILLAAANGHAGVLKDPAPSVEFVQARETVLEFQLQVWSANHLASAGTLKSELNFAVWKGLRAAGLSFSPLRAAGLGTT